MKYGLTPDNQLHIESLARSKKDGCYQCRGVAYKVKNNRVVLYAADGDVLEPCGHFNVIVGKYKGYSDAGLKKLKSIKD